MDIDDDWLSLSPEPSGFKHFTAAAGRAQLKQGGNRTIGRELGRLMETANYQAVNLHVETITSRQLGHASVSRNHHGVQAPVAL